MNLQPHRSPIRLRPTHLWVLLSAALLGLSVCGCKREPAAVQVDGSVLESYAGQYQPDPKTTVEVKRRGDHLEMSINHQAPMVFVAEASGGFIHRESSTRIRFGKGDGGEVNRLELIREGRTHEAPRISAASVSNPTQAVVAGSSSFHFLKHDGPKPTVILWGESGAWNQVQPAVSGFAAVGSFDRKDANGKAAAPVPASPSEAARELHDALVQAKLAPPYVVVGHSFGGALARVFASLYPQEVTGLVLVDPFQEGFVDWLKAHQPQNHEKFVAPMRHRYASNWEQTLAELHAASSYSNLPITLLSAVDRRRQAGNELERDLSTADLAEGSAAIVAAHKEWLGTVPLGRQVIVENSSHDIPRDQPGAVVEAIRQIVEQARSRKPNPNL